MMLQIVCLSAAYLYSDHFIAYAFPISAYSKRSTTAYSKRM